MRGRGQPRLDGVSQPEQGLHPADDFLLFG
jgi:hypothetical protein